MLLAWSFFNFEILWVRELMLMDKLVAFDENYNFKANKNVRYSGWPYRLSRTSVTYEMKHRQASS